MKWQPVSFVEPILPSNIDGLELFHRYRLIFGGGSAFAPLTWPMERPSLPPPLEPLLHQRALRLRNREPKAVAQYMQTHMNLSRGN